jgi:hypothetical protein
MLDIQHSTPQELQTDAAHQCTSNLCINMWSSVQTGFFPMITQVGWGSHHSTGCASACYRGLTFLVALQLPHLQSSQLNSYFTTEYSFSWKVQSSGIQHCVVRTWTNVPEEHTTSIFRGIGSYIDYITLYPRRWQLSLTTNLRTSNYFSWLSWREKMNKYKYGATCLGISTPSCIFIYERHL